MNLSQPISRALSRSLSGQLGGRGTAATSGLTLGVVNNGNGTATMTWSGYNLLAIDPDGSWLPEVSTDGENWNALDTQLPETLTLDATINDQASSYYFRVTARDVSDATLSVSNVFGPLTITGDTAGTAYGAAIDGDGASVTSGYPEEQWLFSELRSQGVLSKIVDGFIRGHNNNTANRRKLVTLGQGTFPAGTVTPSTGFITYSSNGYASYVTNLNAMLGSVNSAGILIDIVDTSLSNFGMPTGTSDNGFNMFQLLRVNTDWLIRLGHESTAAITAALGAYATGMLLFTRTSSSNGALYHYDGINFNTVGSSSGLSGGAVPAFPLYTGAGRNNGGTIDNYTNGKERASLVTTGLSAAESEILMETLWTYYDMKGWV